MNDNNRINDTNSTKITFKNSSGETLVGDLYLPENNPGEGVVFGHCFTCSRHTRIISESCLKLYESGIAALRFDFSGNGQSEGDFANTTYTKHIGEMNIAIDLFREKGISSIGLAGHSMGAAIALLTAAADPEIKAVCTLAGRYSDLNITRLLDAAQKAELEQTGEMNFVSRGRLLKLTEAFFQDAARQKYTKVFSQIKQPLLAVHGDQDDIIPVEEVYDSRKYKPDDTEIEVIEGADHMFSREEHRQQVVEMLVSWFEKYLGK